jgi:predicted metal-dependent phosphoesterase TrpH
MKLDLHVHSNYSRDAVPSVHELISGCQKVGLDGLAITDHNAIEGSLKALELARSAGVLVIRGVEVSTIDGHVLAYGVDALVPRGLTIEETVERIRNLGGIAVAAHPKRFPSGIGLEKAERCDFDAIEVLNGGSSRSANKLARRIADSQQLPQTGGSDAHKLHELGRAFASIEGVSNEDDAIAAIKRGLSRPEGRSRSPKESAVYSYEILMEWLKGGFRRM